MGRPLKIAKATVLTLTNTTTSTNLVTVNSTTSLLPNTPFVIATTTGGLVAGTTYFVLVVTSSTQFTVSATDLTANPTSAQFALSTAGPVTVNMTVASTDTGFNNPAGTANTYSVVGGNTAIYGDQVRTRVAIGITGNGVIVTDSASTGVFGASTDFANTAAVGAAIQTAAGTNIGFVSTVTGTVTIAITSTAATGSFVITSGNAQLFTASKPVVFSANIGGLIAGSVYYVKAIANVTHFTVSNKPSDTAFPVTSETIASNAVQDSIVLVGNAAETNELGVAWVYANDEAGYIVRQKGKTKYLAKGLTTGLTGACYTANVANTALTPNTMNILGTYANAATAYVQSVNDHVGEIFGTGNVFANSSQIVATFNTAEAANTYGGQPYPIVSIDKA
jgi:hypothetical protein